MGTRSRMCHGGWEVWVHGDAVIICVSELIIVRSMVSYCVCCRNYMYIYILIPCSGSLSPRHGASSGCV